MSEKRELAKLIEECEDTPLYEHLTGSVAQYVTNSLKRTRAQVFSLNNELALYRHTVDQVIKAYVAAIEKRDEVYKTYLFDESAQADTIRKLADLGVEENSEWLQRSLDRVSNMVGKAVAIDSKCQNDETQLDVSSAVNSAVHLLYELCTEHDLPLLTEFKAKLKERLQLKTESRVGTTLTVEHINQQLRAMHASIPAPPPEQKAITGPAPPLHPAVVNQLDDAQRNDGVYEGRNPPAPHVVQDQTTQDYIAPRQDPSTDLPQATYNYKRDTHG